MTAEDYELMPERKLSGMKKELEELRRHAASVDPKTGLPKETITSIQNLNSSINSLLTLFKTATEELKLEERDEALISKKMDPLMKKIDTLLDQNEKIAKAIIAIADMVREKTEGIEAKEEKLEEEMEKKPEPELGPKPEGPPMFPPKYEAPPFGAPMPPPPKPSAPPGFPPPPPTGAPEPMPPLGMPEPMPGFEERPKKKGLLGGLFGKK
ncbi:hypothetical protein KY345_05355 [Candidatus Woesearchaeota archaeon]|nr:hypothetical protein [Candidatus Woesearchaeota archaeon]